MMDTGATFSIISDQWLQKHKIDPSDATLEKEAMRPTPVLTANNERVVLNEKRTGLLEIQKSKTIVMARPLQWGFLVKWQGHGDEHNTWESRSQLVGCQEMLTAYLQKLGLEAGTAEAEAVG
ncbi:hypothetical protein QJQ45_011200 [Haematococcus lacustris]|nr:hypothetical protein QJQ45_011200 [Haematococcus lacustris]